MEIKARYVLIGLFTLAAIFAGFTFVYWLNNAGGLSARTTYLVQFDNSVSGLLPGSAVLFNGLRVGEVIGLGLNQDDPSKLIATLAVEPAIPIRQDTTVEVSFQGLTGGAAVSLKGASAGAPPLKGENGRPPMLVAPAGSGRDMAQSARQTLQNLDAILLDNREALKSAIADVSTFAAALARNSDKLDGIVAGLQQLTGSGSKAPPASFDLTAAKDFSNPEMPRGQLAISEPTTAVAFNSQRILRRDGTKLTPVDGGQWADAVPLLVQLRIIDSFENAGFQTVGRPDDKIEAAASLQIEIRDFSLTADPPSGRVEFSAKILGGDGKMLTAQIFQSEAVAASMDAPGATAALNSAFGSAAQKLVVWALAALPR